MNCSGGVVAVDPKLDGFCGAGFTASEAISMRGTAGKNIEGGPKGTKQRKNKRKNSTVHIARKRFTLINRSNALFIFK